MQDTQLQFTEQSGHVGGRGGLSALHWAIGAAGAVAVLIGGFMLVAWFSGAAARWSAAGAITMKANMALGLVLAGTALILLSLCPERQACRWTGLAAATVVLLLGSLTLSEHLVGWDLGIDQLLAREAPGAAATLSPNRAGLLGSAGLTLLGTGLLLLGAGRRGRRMVPYLGLTIILICLVLAVGFLYGIGVFFTLPATAIAWPTLFAMLGLGLGLVIVCPDSGPMTLLLRDDAGGKLLRGLLPTVLLLPLGLGFLRVLGQSRGLYDTAMGTGLLVLALMLAFSLMLWRSAGHLSSADRQQKQTEETLRESESFFRQMLESIPGMVFTTRPDGYCDYQSRQWVEFTGIPMSEHVGDGWSKLLHPDDRARAFAARRDAVEGRVPYDLEYRVRRYDGQYEWFSVRGRAICDAAGQVIRWFGVAISIEALKQSENELRQAKDIAEAASKAKDHFIAVLSHELRNPLNPVLVAVAMLQKDARFDADTREQLEVIHRNAELEARLIDDLLDVTRIERGKVELTRQPIELCTILHRAAEVCRPDIEVRKLEFGIDLGPAPYWVDADAARLQQVFWNLIKNSIKFTSVGGCVGIRCRRDGDGHVIAEVNDSGEGIAPEVLPRLFNAFEQGGRPMTRQFGGLGLGLTISRAMVELHGGTIQAHSEGRGKGATFTVRLPLLPANAAVPASTSASPAARAVAIRPLRILLVEDHGDSARTMRRLLMAAGHEVQLAADVATALQLANGHAFDLLLSDLGLPDGSGLDLIRALRQSGSQLPGIALSGYGQEHDMQQSREAGFAIHLVKPVNMQRLEEAIAQTAGDLRTAR